MKKYITMFAILMLAGFALAIGAPQIFSSTHVDGEWSNKQAAKFSWDEVDGATKYLYQTTLNEVPSAGAWKETDKNNVYLTGIGEGKRNFFLEACDEKNTCSEPAVFELLIDKTSPGRVTITSGTSTSAGIVLEWTEAQDADSGVGGYYIYRSTKEYYGSREFLPTDASVTKLESKENTFVDSEDLQDGLGYYYKIQAIDNAGNVGPLTGITNIVNDSSGSDVKTAAQEVKEDLTATQDGAQEQAKAPDAAPSETAPTQTNTNAEVAGNDSAAQNNAVAQANNQPQKSDLSLLLPVIFVLAVGGMIAFFAMPKKPVHAQKAAKKWP